MIDSTQDHQDAIDRGLHSIYEFFLTPPVQRFFSDIYSLDEEMRHEAVEIMLDDRERFVRSYGIEFPDDIKIQRSEFEDKRPTLFCITKKLPEGLRWKKVTLTFDNPAGTTFVPVDHSRLEKG